MTGYIRYRLSIKPRGEDWREVGLFASKDRADRTVVALCDDHDEWLPMECVIEPVETVLSYAGEISSSPVIF